MFQCDLNTVPMEFDDSAYKSKQRLKIGYFDNDNWFTPCQTSKRAVKEAVAALTRAGHLCVPFKPPTDGWHSYGLLVGVCLVLQV